MRLQKLGLDQAHTPHTHTHPLTKYNIVLLAIGTVFYNRSLEVFFLE